MTTVTNTETLEQIAERLVYEGMNFHPDVPLTRPYRAFAAAIVGALRNEREACAKVAESFRVGTPGRRRPTLEAQDNTAIGIAKAIREGRQPK